MAPASAARIRERRWKRRERRILRFWNRLCGGVPHKHNECTRCGLDLKDHEYARAGRVAGEDSWMAPALGHAFQPCDWLMRKNHRPDLGAGRPPHGYGDDVTAVPSP